MYDSSLAMHSLMEWLDAAKSLLDHEVTH